MQSIFGGESSEEKSEIIQFANSVPHNNERELQKCESSKFACKEGAVERGGIGVRPYAILDKTQIPGWSSQHPRCQAQRQKKQCLHQILSVSYFPYAYYRYYRLNGLIRLS
jgi:hypothetical protein